MTTVLALSGQLRLVGAVLVLVGVSHVALPRALAWAPQVRALRPLTRRVMYVHTLFIGLTCVLLGLLPLGLADELLAPEPLPRAVLGAEFVFWGLRWCVQFAAFPPALWRTSRLHTAAYLGLGLLWTWVVVVFGAALVRVW